MVYLRLSIAIILVIVLWVAIACQKENDTDEIPPTTSEHRIKTESIYRNDTLIRVKEFNYENDKLVEIISNFVGENLSYFPDYKYEFEYVSQNLVTDKYFLKFYDEWTLATSSERKYSAGKIIEYTENNEIIGGQFSRKFLFEYSNDHLFHLETFDQNEDEADKFEFCIYEDGKLIKTRVYELNYGMDSVCIINEFIWDGNGNLIELLQHDRYYLGYWETNNKMTFEYSRNKLIEVTSYKNHETGFLPVSIYNFSYNLAGKVAVMSLLELHNDITHRYAYSYENANGNLCDLIVKQPYARWGYWYPEIHLWYDYPPL